jgi:protein translocase SecG subunit
MQKIVNFAQIVVAVLVITLILLQNKGSGLGAVFGGGDGNVFHTKRGPEKWLFYGTIIAVVLFMVLGVVNLLLNKNQ